MKHVASGLLATCIYICVPVSASAQPTPEGASADMDEIVVTAQKRRQALNDVGLTITAATSEQLRNVGVTDITKLAKAVSGFTVSTTFDGLPIFYIRGLGFAANQYSAAPTVSAYVDEVPLPYSPMTGGVTLDLERVEVLKGPQGTLFGNNSTGGSINFIAAKPTDTLSAGIVGSVDRFGQIFVEGFASGPLNDQVKVRLAGSTTQGGAWQRSYTPGPKMKNGSADKGAFRALVDWQPVEALKLQLNANYSYDKSEPQALQLLQARPSGGPGSGYVDPLYGSIETYPLPPRDNRAADLTPNPVRKFFRDDKLYQIAFRGDLELSDAVTLTSISNYSRFKADTNRDVDGTKIDIIEGGHSGTIKTFAQELRLTADLDSINLIAGANYSDDKVDERQPYIFSHFSILPPDIVFDNYGNFTSKTAAIFGNAEFKLTDIVTLTGGVRYTRVKQSFDACLPDRGDGNVAAFLSTLANIFRGINGLPPTTAFQPNMCVTLGPSPDYLPFRYLDTSVDRNLSWRAGLNFKPNRDLLLYALISRGYKAGGYPFNTPLTFDQLSKVRQEQVTAYEGGFKYSPSRIFDLTAAGFYYDYKDKQIFTNTLVPFLGPVSTLNNIPKSRAYGFELEGTVRPVEGVRLHGALTYADTAIQDPGNVLLDGFGNPTDLRGRPFGNAPKWTAVFDAEYRVATGGNIDLIFGGNGVYNSKSFARSEPTAEFSIASYALFDARIGLESRAGWTATAWVRNITNKYYWLDVNFIGEGYLKTAGQPRNYGLTLGYRF